MVEEQNLTSEQKVLVDELLERIRPNKKELICPICDNKKFTLAEGYTSRFLTNKIKEIQIGGKNIPAITIICNNCGFVLDFSIGVLGFLDIQEVKEDANK